MVEVTDWINLDEDDTKTPPRTPPRTIGFVDEVMEVGDVLVIATGNLVDILRTGSRSYCVVDVPRFEWGGVDLATDIVDFGCSDIINGQRHFALKIANREDDIHLRGRMSFSSTGHCSYVFEAFTK